MAKGASSARWLREHVRDFYVKQARLEGYRSRAAYKLLALHAQYKLFKEGMVVVDLGAAPGSWSQVLIQLVKIPGNVLSIDLLPLIPIQGVKMIQGEMTSEAVYQQIIEFSVQHKRVHWLVSDVAPNLSGINSIDQSIILHLANETVQLALKILKINGGCLLKVFQGEGIDQLVIRLKKLFSRVLVTKPTASRGRSREIYLLAQGFHL